MATTRELGGSKRTVVYWEKSCPVCGQQNLARKGARRMECRGCHQAVSLPRPRRKERERG